MLISYPILPNPTAQSGESELEAFVRTYVDKSQGLYPVSFEDRWHGGIHLRSGNAPIRAIADGEVVAYRVAPAPETYRGDDFDTSFILLKHITETGENTPVVFYSLYMHLRNRRDLKRELREQMPEWLQQVTPSTEVKSGNGQLVWRKEILGVAGSLYGERHVHFEIFAPDIDGFWKDSQALAQGANGSPDFFGDAGFVIPLGTHFLATHPDAKPHGGNSNAALYAGQQEEPAGEEGYSGGDLSTIAPIPIDSFLDGAGTEYVSTDGRLFVALRYDKGKRIATSYQLNAQGDVELIGEPVVQEDYEYNLYSIATALYDDCPSAGYELLRFGRVLGPDTTNQLHNWQWVRYGKDPHAVGYVDLAAANITKLSDADFPFWQDWQRMDESKGVIQPDGICHVPTLLDLLNLPSDPNTPSLSTPADFAAKASDPVVARKLRHLVCKFSTEWDDSDLDLRYQRWYQSGQRLADPAAQRDFKEHVAKMVFWSSTQLPRSVWHFHPLQFVEHYRKCGWRSLREMVQTVSPKEISTDPITGGETLLTWEKTSQILIPHYKEMNLTFRKYGLVTTMRLSAFLGQCYVEIGYFAKMEESGAGHPEAFKANPSAGQQAKYYAAFFGRGFMQLTWAGTYANYGKFRNFPDNASETYKDPRITQTSTHYASSPDNGGKPMQWYPRYDPDLVASDSYADVDSGGFVWAGKHFLGHSDINRVADMGMNTRSVSQICLLINGGSSNLDRRQRASAYIYRALSDSVDDATREKLNYPGAKIASKPQPHWIDADSGEGSPITVDYTPQRP